ncbi:MAG: carbon storage regulator [Planctomycetaceae bacterium]
MILSRSAGERIVIDGDIGVVILARDGNRGRGGIGAPRQCQIAGIATRVSPRPTASRGDPAPGRRPAFTAHFSRAPCLTATLQQ